MSTANLWLLVALGAAVAAAAFAALALALRRAPPSVTDGRRGAEGEEGETQSLQMSDGDPAVWAAEQEARRLRKAAAFASTLDLTELSVRILEVTVTTCEADAAAIGIRQPGGDGSLVESVALSEAEITWLAAGLEAENESAVIMRYPVDGDAPAGDRIGTAVIVPLRGRDGDHVGNLAALWRRDLERRADEQLAVLEDVAHAAWNAVDNARRFHEVWALSIRDALTGLFNRRYFLGKLAEEVERARRHAPRSLAVLVFDIDGFKAVNERLGHSGGDAVLADVAKWVRAVVRSSDTACRLDGDEFAVILPESTLADAERLFERIGEALTRVAVVDEVILRCSGGAAELRDDDSGTSLFERAEHALFTAQDSGTGVGVAA